MPALGFCAVGAHRRWNGARPGGVSLWVSPYAVGTAGNGACPAGAPFLEKKWGKESPGEEPPPPGPPSLAGWYGGGCTSFLVPGLRPSQWKARNGPPTGWAGWGRGWVPFGRRQKVTVWFPAFSSRQQTTSPAHPSWWAGHEALVLEAAGQAHTAPTTFPYFFKEIGPRPGRAPFPPVPTAPRKNHNAPQGASLSLR